MTVSKDTEVSAYLEAYRQHSASLRTWFVAYGIGAPVLFADKEILWQKLTEANSLRCVAIPFFLGIAIQIILSLFDKYADWLCVYKILKEPARNKFRDRFATWWMSQDAVSFSLDAATIALFVYATLKAINAVAPPV